MVKNSARYCNRVWISGGEATLFEKMVDRIVKKCREASIQYGYPKEICLQTNANWGKDDDVLRKKLGHFQEIGITDLDISSNDIYHFEQIGNCVTPRKVAEIALKEYHFNSVTLAGSPTKGLKLLG